MIPEIIALLVIAAFGILFLQIESHISKYKIIALVIVCIILYVSLLALFSTDEIDLKSPKSIVNGLYIYMGWLGQTASSVWDIGKDTTHLVGNAIKVNNTEEERPRR